MKLPRSVCSEIRDFFILLGKQKQKQNKSLIILPQSFCSKELFNARKSPPIIVCDPYNCCTRNSSLSVPIRPHLTRDTYGRGVGLDGLLGRVVCFLLLSRVIKLLDGKKPEIGDKGMGRDRLLMHL